MNKFQANRYFLKDSLRKTIDFRKSDQYCGIPQPPLQQPLEKGLVYIDLPDKTQWLSEMDSCDLVNAMQERKSDRNFTTDPLSLAELTFLLWATQGQRQPEKGQPHLRTVPSAGARHSFETYLFVHRVEGLSSGLYRFLPLSNELVLLHETDESIGAHLSRASFGQKFVANCSVTFVWTTVPYRTEWRYLEAAHRVILLDAGHVCQNLYLACKNIGAGTCAVAAYDQDLMDELLGVDGEEEFTIYLAPVGKIARKRL